MTNDDIIDALLEQKQFLEDNESGLLAKCQTDADRSVIRASVTRARDQWNTAVNATLRLDDVQLFALINQLDDVRQDVQSMLESDGVLAGILNRITTGIIIGTKIVALLK